MIRPDPLRSINLVWYAITLVPLGLVLWLCLGGVLPPLLLLPVAFLSVFWLFSLLFALYALWRRRAQAARKAVQ